MMSTKAFRNDAIEKVSGTAKFCADNTMPGMLHIKTVWTKQICAVVKSINTEKAEKAPGVVRVITAKDVKGTNLAAVFDPYDRPVLVPVGQKVRYAGDSLALIVASTEEEAANAAELVEVEYEPYEDAHSIPDAVKMLEPFSTYQIKKGDISDGFEASDLILEDTYYLPQAEHAYLEPEAGYAWIDGIGVINICYGSQNLARHHRMICKSLGLSYNKVRLVSPFVGGAFGGKHSISVQIHLALAASVTRRPVKMVWTREESFFASSKRHELEAHMRIGFSKEGKIKAAQLDIVCAAGSYIGYSERTVYTASRYILGAYYGETLLSTAKIYLTSNPEVAAFRGFGAPEGTLIIETMLERAARRLNLSPVEIRKRNILTKEQVDNQFDGSFWKLVSDNVTAMETLEKAMEAIGEPPTPKSGKKHGRGISLGMPMFGIGDTPGYKGTGADITMYLDGSVSVRIGFPEIGQGITGVVTALVEEVLGIPQEKVSLVYGDNHTTPKAGSLGFSQATVNCGNAVLDAAKKLKLRLEQIAQEILKTDDPIVFSNNRFYRNGKECIDFDEFMDYTYIQGTNMTVSGWFEGPDPTDRAGITFMAGVVDVEVDEETGEVEVCKVVNCHDIGTVIHPVSARGQMLGGTVMAIGTALMEEFQMKGGRTTTPSFAEYLIPTAMDIPKESTALFVEDKGNHCPLGGKGLGEHGLYTTPPAIINAILDAVGVEINTIPVTPERLLRAMGKI